MIKVIQGDCLDTMRQIPDSVLDSIVTDPPYGLDFMGKEWDHGVPGVPFWAEALRVAKPGAYLVAFGGTRTYHRLACAIEDAGWEVRDCLSWLYGSGFPKSLDVSKALDKARGPREDVIAFGAAYGAARAAVGMSHAQACALVGAHGAVNHGGASVNWEKGYALPPPEAWPTLRDALRLGALESEYVRLLEARGEPGEAWYLRAKIGERNLREVTIDPGNYSGRGPARPVDVTEAHTDLARQWAGWGTALKPAWEPAILARKPLIGTVAQNITAHGTGGINVDACRIGTGEDRSPGGATGLRVSAGEGFGGGWSDASEGRARPEGGRWPANVLLDEVAAEALDAQTGSSGGASRFFYTAKASKSERGQGNNHPTVKPLALMRWIVRLVTPPGGLVLDPFAGSGTTGLAARAEGMRALLCEREPEYVEIIRARLAAG